MAPLAAESAAPSAPSQPAPRHQDALADEDFAFPRERKEPIEDARHVRSAVARFNQVKGVTDAERDEAWRRIEAAAKTFGVELHEQDWRELRRPKR